MVAEATVEAAVEDGDETTEPKPMDVAEVEVAEVAMVEEAVAEVEVAVVIVLNAEEGDLALSKALLPTDIIPLRNTLPSRPRICLNYLISDQPVTPQEESVQLQLKLQHQKPDWQLLARGPPANESLHDPRQTHSL